MRRKHVIAPLVGLALMVPTDEAVANRGTVSLMTADSAYRSPAADGAGYADPARLDLAEMAATRGGQYCHWWDNGCTRRLLRVYRRLFRWLRSVSSGGSYLWSSTESVEESVLSEQYDPSLPYSYTEYYNEDQTRDEYYETEADAANGAYWGSSDTNSGVYYSHTVYSGGGGGGGGGCETGCDPY